jgi:hypothetical protein
MALLHVRVKLHQDNSQQLNLLNPEVFYIFLQSEKTSSLSTLALDKTNNWFHHVSLLESGIVLLPNRKTMEELAGKLKKQA